MVLQTLFRNSNGFKINFKKLYTPYTLHEDTEPPPQTTLMSKSTTVLFICTFVKSSWLTEIVTSQNIPRKTTSRTTRSTVFPTNVPQAYLLYLPHKCPSLLTVSWAKMLHHFAWNWQNAKRDGTLHTTCIQVRHFLKDHIQQYRFKMLHYNPSVEE